jgi:hypothetical protein
MVIKYNGAVEKESGEKPKESRAKKQEDSASRASKKNKYSTTGGFKMTHEQSRGNGQVKCPTQFSSLHHNKPIQVGNQSKKHGLRF